MNPTVEEPLFSDYLFQAPAPAVAKPATKANAALEPQVISQEVFTSSALRRHAYYADDYTLLFNLDVNDGLRLLKEHGIQINCLVTSPPFYGQRDYGVEGQIGLEEHPREFIGRLVEVFENAKPILADNGSAWVNLGDTYWSGKGEHKSGEAKQGARRFGVRPQDKKGDGELCVPKQLLLIPHRFAIGMQDEGWIVRNDNVLYERPDTALRQARDRCSHAHEYAFHFVRSRWYYFNKEAVGRKRPSKTTMPPLDSWHITNNVNSKKAREQRFLLERVRLPILATTPPKGVVLELYPSNSAALMLSKANNFRFIGISSNESALTSLLPQLM